MLHVVCGVRRIADESSTFLCINYLFMSENLKTFSAEMSNDIHSILNLKCTKCTHSKFCIPSRYGCFIVATEETIAFKLKLLQTSNRNSLSTPSLFNCHPHPTSLLRYTKNGWRYWALHHIRHSNFTSLRFDKNLNIDSIPKWIFFSCLWHRPQCSNDGRYWMWIQGIIQLIMLVWSTTPIRYNRMPRKKKTEKEWERTIIIISFCFTRERQLRSTFFYSFLFFVI